VKINSDGSLNRYRVRLVSLRKKQEYDVDCDETLTIVGVLSMATFKGWSLH